MMYAGSNNYSGRYSSARDANVGDGSNGWSGSGYDRWVERNSTQHSSTLGKVQRQFWFTKSAVMRKLGKNQDEHVVASDAQLDAKMELFKAIETSTRDLQASLADYQSKVCVLAQEENAMGRMLKDWGRQDRGTASQVMTATGKSLSYTAQQRLALRAPLVRLFQEVDTFQSRAIEDTGHTLAQMEKMRTEYRGALMWMKNISQDFNPDQYSQLDKFRQVQEIVRQKKAKFDILKLKCIQKIDLLAASRCNMFSHALILYQNAIILFSEKTAKTLNTVASNFQGYQQYNFQVIKELAEPEALRNIDNKDTSTDDRNFFGEDYHDENNDDAQKSTNLCPRHGNQTSGPKCKDSDSLFNLYENIDGSDSATTNNINNSDDRSKNVNQTTSNIDLLGSAEETEKDTQQMLRELFDSPIHKPIPATQGTAFNFMDSSSQRPNLQGETLQKGSSAIGPSGNQSQMFMPSQLLDFGMRDWGQTGQNTGSPAGSISRTMHNTSSMSSNILAHGATAATAGKQASTPSSTISNMAGGRGASVVPGTTGETLASGNQLQDLSSAAAGGDKDGKLDWYRVFQDIDPLSDPSNDFFAKKGSGEESGSC
uniref:Islet cell autoantigen 1-like n=1 Tax=Hirondellea gigas TaxID=1518452 RepID=A0A6A7FX54_9CRUS